MYVTIIYSDDDDDDMAKEQTMFVGCNSVFGYGLVSSKCCNCLTIEIWHFVLGQWDIQLIPMCSMALYLVH